MASNKQRVRWKLLLLLILAAIAGIIYYKYIRLRFISILPHVHTMDMDSRSLEGYTNTQFYLPGDTVIFYLHSSQDSNTLSLKLSVGLNQYEEVTSFSFPRITQVVNTTQSVKGCNWQPTFAYPLPNNLKPGYYRALLTSGLTSDSSWITFLVGTRDTNASIAIIAPVTTWHAYNPWGGKSLYVNSVDKENVNLISTQRPLTTFENNHDLNVEMNIFNWYEKEYGNVALYPDYMLEASPSLFKNTKVLVLSYHNEYFSSGMWDAVEKLVKEDGKSLISLGGNQMYWKVRWHNNHTLLECHKDFTFFKHPLGLGGMWRHNLRFAERLLGVRYTGAGIHTYAPYKLLLPEHWLVKDLHLPKDTLFGFGSINHDPISGSEIDKSDMLSGDIEIIAKGLNPNKGAHDPDTYQPNNPNWNGDGGAELVLKTFEKSSVLSTGAVHSGAGLGYDSVFTHIIRTFTNRFVR